MKRLLLLILVLISIGNRATYAQCSTTNATSCVCKDAGQTDCDLLPDIQIGHPPFFDYGATYGIIEYSQTGNGVDNGRLKITVSTPNPGHGPLELRARSIFVCDTDTFIGAPPSICPDGITYPAILINQRIYHKSGNTMSHYDRAAGTMTYHPTHSHMHVDDWGVYTLRTRDTSEADPRNWPIIGAGSKLAFCVMDYGTCAGYPDHCLDSVGNSLNSNSDFPNYGLGGGNYSCSPNVQGISSGYVDIYWTSLDGMWIDVPPGTCNGEYWIVTEVDPNNNFLEADETNNVYAVPYNLTKQEPNPATQQVRVNIQNSVLNLCAGESTVLEVDSSVSALSYLWSNGDTTRSTTVSAAGRYSVQISNQCGTGQSVDVDVNVFSPPSAPVGTNDTILTPGTANLTAIAPGNISWYDSPSGGSALGIGSIFTTPFINNTTTFYAEAEVLHPGASMNIGPADSAVSGGSSSTTNQYLIFDCYNPFTLHSVKVYAQSAGTRTIELRNDQNTVLQSRVVSVLAGENTVILDFNITPGSAYRLAKTGGELFRNNIASGLSFPYTIDNFCSITSTSQGTGYYYFFYNWEIRLPGASCISARTPVTAVVNQPNLLGDIDKLNSLSVYPNPATENITVEFRIHQIKNARINLLDALGNVVSTSKIASASGEFKESVDVSGLAKGVYMIQILASNKNYYHKLVIQ
ncbi:MAG: T9SS C-terminal target domain-containing protein [Bacteroidetes bacterium]|nr:MAG: T9SS C-terminal target domain-containing protein [Bacteroidota bacterium]